MDSAVDGSIDISIRSYDEQIQQAYRSLFPGDPQKSPELLDWRFQANPHGLAKFAVAVEGSEIVGMIALVPTRLVGSKAAMTGYQAIDTVVHPSFRGRGLFVRMGAAAQDKEALGGGLFWPYNGPFQAGQALTLTSSCNATSTWLAQATNQPPPVQGQKGERVR